MRCQDIHSLTQSQWSKVPEFQTGCDLQSIEEAILLVIRALGPLSTMRISQICCYTVPIKLLAGTNIFLTHAGLWKRLPVVCEIPFNQILSTDLGGSTVLQNFASPFLLLRVVPKISPLFLDWQKRRLRGNSFARPFPSTRLSGDLLLPPFRNYYTDA